MKYYGQSEAVAKEIIELHGQRIWAESGDSQGARFVFTLPISKGG